jgi:Tol biopolymer transport system component
MPLADVLPIARQIAEALEAAHEQGIVHRDLKPANIKVRPDGTVKVLDFGLAKALDPAGASGSGELMHSPTMTARATQMGMIIGTAAYMAPEQAKGKAVDRRADIWAFGVVLYEMLTGRRAFPGDDVSETLASVLAREADLAALPANTPAPVRRLVARCLEKDPKQRIRAIGDAMRRLDEDLASAAPPPVTAAATHRGRSSRALWLALAVTSLAAAGLAVPAVRHLREAPPALPPEIRLDIVTPAAEDPVSFALSPDGRQIVYAASGDGGSRLWLRRLDATAGQPLNGTEGGAYPFWSPDGRSIAFFADSKLKRLDVGGGPPQVLAAAPGGRGGTWNGDGVILFAPCQSCALQRVGAAGGDAVAATTFSEKQAGHRFPAFLPGGREFVFFAQGTAAIQGVYLGSLDGPDTRRLTASDTAARYVAPGWLLWIQGGTLRAQRLERSTKQLVGDPVTLADPVAFPPGVHVGAFSVSDGGLVAYRGGGAQRRQLAWFDRAGRSRGMLGPPDENVLQEVRLSPDGRRVAVRRTVQGNIDIWLTDDARTSRVTFDAAQESFPVWSPDGGRIVFASNRKGSLDLFVRPSNGTGAEDLLAESTQTKSPSDWSGDGRFLLFNSLDPQSGWDLWVMPMSGARTARVFLKTPFNERRPRVSPDGRWVAYQSDESNRVEVFVRPFDPSGSGDAGGLWQISTAGGVYPVWRADGRELYYLAPDGAVMAVPIAMRGGEVVSGTPVALFSPRIFGGGFEASQGWQYDVTRDGRFLVNTSLADTAAVPITLVQHWNPEAKR